MVGQHDLGDLALDLETGEERRHEFTAADIAPHLGDDEGGGKRRDRRVGQQPVLVAGIAGHLGVVPVMGMPGRAQDPGRRRRRRLGITLAEHQRVFPPAGGDGLLGQDLCRRLDTAGDVKR